MAQLSYISIISAITAIPAIIIFIFISQLVSPSSALEFTSPDIFFGEAGPLIYGGTCLSGSGNYTRGTDYESNLFTAFSNLTAAAAASKTFSNATVGSGSGDKVHASFYCLRNNNMKPNDCHDCVKNTTKILSQKCATREAIMSSNMCSLRYSYRLDFPEDDAASQLTCPFQAAMMPDPVKFNQTVTAMMERFIEQVTTNSSGSLSSSSQTMFFSEVEAESYMDQKVYMAIHCPPVEVISRRGCKECLTRALNETMQCSSMGAHAGSDFRPNCWMRYSLQPINAATSTTPGSSQNSSPNLSRSDNASHNPGSRWLASPLGIIAAAIIFLLS